MKIFAWSPFLWSVGANWLHQCTECVDQSLFSDASLKTDIVSANITLLYEQVKQLKVRQFEHIEKEFFNRFFSRTNQLGLIAQELEQVCPSAVSLIPERRSASTNGTSVSTKNVLMVRESHILFLLAGSVQELIFRVERMGSDYWGRVGEWEQLLNKLKLEMGQLLSDQSNLLTSVNRVETKFFFLESLSEKTEKNLDQISGKHLFLETSTKFLNERIVQLEANLVAFQEKFREGVVREKLLAEMARFDAQEELRLLRIKQTELENALNKSAQMRLILSNRMVNIENEFFVLSNRAKILSKIQFEKFRQKSAAQARNLGFELAARREGFDADLVRLREEADMRVTKSKLAGDLQIVEKKLAVEREKLKVELAVRVEEARMEGETRLRDKRENEDINMRELAVRTEGEKEKILLIIRETARVVMDTVSAVYSNPQNLWLGIGSILLLIGGIFFAREFATLVREQISKNLGKPSLIRIFSKETKLQTIWRKFFPKKTDSCFSDVVLTSNLFDRIHRLAIATRTAKLRNSPLLHCLYYGPPGTGKTMVAKRFAEFSNLDYAIMCGGDVAPLGADGVTEIHNLFKWIKSSHRGVLLFIDEAESFLCARSAGMSENLRNAITAILYHTGTASSQFMLILATNRPSDLDAAIVDRMDESIEFGLPDSAERERLVRMYYDCNHPPDDPSPGYEVVGDQIDAACLKSVAESLVGFSGREISKLFISLQTHLYSMGKTECDLKTLELVVNLKIAEHAKNRDIAKNGYVFDESLLHKT